MNAYERIASTFTGKRADEEEAEEPAIWKERKDAKATLRAYLNDFPSAWYLFCLGHWVDISASNGCGYTRTCGSRKGRPCRECNEGRGQVRWELTSSKIRASLKNLTCRPSLVIDCAKILNAPTDSATVRELAKQTGYWPYFSFLTSLNNMIDLASVGLIGQKGKLKHNNYAHTMTNS